MMRPMTVDSGRSTVTLADGSRLAIRPIEPSDRELVAAGFKRLSPESRYRRFFSPLPELSGRQLDYLTRVDHHDHEALVAVDTDSGEGVAVARFVRVGDRVAEPAIAVVDDWQGRGVAAALLERLVERAREEGIERFVALVMADNPQAMRVLERLGQTRTDQEGPEVELEIELAEPAGAAASVRGLLGSIAEDAVQPALTLWHRVAPRRGARARVLENVVVAEAMAGGEDGEAVRQAAEIARASGAALHLVAARPLLLADQTGLEERLQVAADDLAAPGAPVEAHLHRSEPATALLDVAVETHARLIVVEDIERSDPAEHLLGPAWRHVAHHAPCDVLIARAPCQPRWIQAKPEPRRRRSGRRPRPRSTRVRRGPPRSRSRSPAPGPSRCASERRRRGRSARTHAAPARSRSPALVGDVDLEGPVDAPGAELDLAGPVAERVVDQVAERLARPERIEARLEPGRRLDRQLAAL